MSTTRQFFLRPPNCPITTGDLLPISYDNVVRDGYLLCDGSEIDRLDYSLLFSVIDTIYGVGNGSTTFNLPDFRGKWIRGWGGNAAAIGTYQSSAFQSHTHTYIRDGSPNNVSGYSLAAASHSTYRSTYGGINNDPSNNTTRPRSLTVNWVIRYI